MKPQLDYTLYLVTDQKLMSTPTLEEAVEAACRGGVTLVQIREKSASDEAFESVARRCKATFAVLADRDKRIERIMARDGITREYAALRVDAQKPDSYFEEKCDYILKNNSTEEEFREKCRSKFLEVID